MAVKTYLVSFEHEFIDGDSVNFDQSATESALTSAGATIDTNWDHDFVGMYKIDIDDAFIVIILCYSSSLESKYLS